jgi:hypothetical protein
MTINLYSRSLNFGYGQALSGIGVELQVVPKTGKLPIGQFVITDRSAEMRANIAKGSDHAIAAEYEDIVIADPAGELTGRLQLGDIADFDKTDRRSGVLRLLVVQLEILHLRAAQRVRHDGLCGRCRRRLAQHDPHSVEKIDRQSKLAQ